MNTQLSIELPKNTYLTREQLKGFLVWKDMPKNSVVYLRLGFVLSGEHSNDVTCVSQKVFKLEETSGRCEFETALPASPRSGDIGGKLFSCSWLLEAVSSDGTKRAEEDLTVR